MADPFVGHFTLAADVSKQLITLSTGVLTLMLTYGNGIGRVSSLPAKRTLIFAAGVYLASIIFGIATVMTLVGQMAAVVAQQPSAGIYAGNVRLMAILQIILFLAGIGLTIRFGYLCLTPDVKPEDGAGQNGLASKQPAASAPPKPTGSN